MSDSDSPHKSPSEARRVADIFAKVLKFALPLTVSAGLVVWMFHKIDFNHVVGIMRDGVDYRFILVMCLLEILSFIIRGIRWGIQLRAAGIPRMPWLAESVSIFGAYSLNLLFPYLGEAWRCLYVSRRQKCKLSTVVGTDFGDRISDAIVILFLILLTLWVADPAIHRFMSHYSIGEKFNRILSDGSLWISLAAVIAVIAAACFLLRRRKFMQGVFTSARRIWQGFAVLFHMQGIGLYIVLTFGIWICYFLETYMCFFAFGFTRQLISNPDMAYGLIPGLVVFVFGSISIAVPSNGGLGAWNIAVMFALMLYGVSSDQAAAYSIVCWSFLAVTEIAVGIFSMFYIQWDRRHPSGRSAPVSESMM